MREREREREEEEARSRGTVCRGAAAACAFVIVTGTTREPSERKLLYSRGLPRDLFAISGFPQGPPPCVAELRGDVVRLLERSGRAADARGQIGGPTWRRAPAVGHGRTAGGSLARRLRFLLSPSLSLSVWLKRN